MDFDDLDDEEAVREDELKPELGPTRPPAERPYDIVVYGATGFTGRLCALHLDAVAEEATKADRAGLKWAIAGRDAERLSTLARCCRTAPGVIVAKTPEEVAAMCAQCRVVVSTAGPYKLTGEPVIRACIASGTHYVDVAGELLWLKQMVGRYDAEARTKGVMIVIMCGMQSVPSDLCVNMLVKHLGPLRQARGYMVQYGFTTGGTDAAGRGTMETIADDPWILKEVHDPFSLGGVRTVVRDLDLDCSAPEQDTLYPNVWLGALGCAAVDARAIRRSCMLFEKRGGGSDDLRYGDDVSVVMREPSANKAAAERTVQACGPLQDAEYAPAILASMKEAVKAGQSPPPGAGPPPEAREHFYTNLLFVAEGESGDWATSSYAGGENYEVTAMCATTGALTLLDELPVLRPEARGGLVSPAFAFFGSDFAERLQRYRWACKPKGASIKFEVQDGKPSEKYIKELIVKRTKDNAAFQEKVRLGELKAWSNPEV